MKNILLGVTATCLILITGKMYLGDMQTAQAASGIQKVAVCDADGYECAQIGNVGYTYKGLLVSTTP